jgi:hypothetical protein
MLRRHGQKQPSSHQERIRPLLEALEPRLLLSGDFVPGATDAMADGLDRLDGRLDAVTGGEALLGERVPMVLTVEVTSEGDVKYEAPTIGDLFSVPVDANGDGHIAWNPLTDPLNDDETDDDESILDALDTDTEGDPGYGQVDIGEFLSGWFFNPVRNWLYNTNGSETTEDFTDFLVEDNPLNGSLNRYLSDLSGVYIVDFNIIEAQVEDFTQDPDAQVSFSVGFELSITQWLPIDLGLEADALKLQAFTGSPFDPQLPTVPVTSTLDFGFDFGVFTGGQEEAEINAADFFIRKANPLVLSVTAQDARSDFNFNIGFLGAGWTAPSTCRPTSSRHCSIRTIRTFSASLTASTASSRPAW